MNLTGVTNATAVNQVVTGTAPTTASVTTAAPIAFVTYTRPSTSTAAAQLPFYLPQPSGVGQSATSPSQYQHLYHSAHRAARWRVLAR